ncbi:MAG: hypothetical protein J6S74_01835, partial [Alphaproteobacteria bacterium]|nr:hypothetical protein [Alphaproteobacteria bacterium]
MRNFARFLLVMLCATPLGLANAVVSSTAGNNLTAYNGESGATNNNKWNNLMNARSGGSENNATADFGNCNALIMRCAQPKCSSGGCTDMSVTGAIVSGCVQSNAACKQYGDELVEYISAQLIASSTAKANAANAASAAAANAAAQQNAQQMAAMQQQMQQMQMEMAQQNAQTVAQLQNALNEQKQMTADAIASVNAARQDTNTYQPTQPVEASRDLTDSQIVAAQNGVSADVLAREQISGKILSSIENAETQLKTLKATMNNVFEYAGCDSRGNNCSGPKRVKMFKQKAEGFFDPYENVLDEMYDALVLAQSVGVDITDIYMMLNGSCNVWGKYLCDLGAATTEYVTVCREDNTTTVTTKDGTQETNIKTCGQELRPRTLTTMYTTTNCVNGVSKQDGRVRGGHECSPNTVVPPEDDATCTLQSTIVDDGSEDSKVQRDWLWADASDSGANIRVGCASSALETSKLFRGRKKQASIDIETLQRIIAQDAPQVIGGAYSNKSVSPADGAKYCAIGDEYAELQKAVELKRLPPKVCLKESEFNNWANIHGTSNGNTQDTQMSQGMIEMSHAYCDAYAKNGAVWNSWNNTCNCDKIK